MSVERECVCVFSVCVHLAWFSVCVHLFLTKTRSLSGIETLSLARTTIWFGSLLTFRAS